MNVASYKALSDPMADLVAGLRARAIERSRQDADRQRMVEKSVLDGMSKEEAMRRKLGYEKVSEFDPKTGAMIDYWRPRGSGATIDVTNGGDGGAGVDEAIEAAGLNAGNGSKRVTGGGSLAHPIIDISAFVNQAMPKTNPLIPDTPDEYVSPEMESMYLDIVSKLNAL